MVSGQSKGSRFGSKGEENLGNGLKVGFVLENGYAADSGDFSQGGRLFGRDARLYLDGNFGYLSFGRMGPIVGGNGPYARFGHVVSPFSCGWGEIGGILQVVSLGYDYVDNAVAYTTPVFAGLDASVQYSFGTDTTKYGSGVEGKSSVKHMASGAIRYRNDKMTVAFGVESINQGSLPPTRHGSTTASPGTSARISTPVGRSSTATLRSSKAMRPRPRRPPSRSLRVWTVGASTSASTCPPSEARRSSASATAISKGASTPT